MACYLYRPDLINKWFQTEITRDSTAEPGGISKTRQVPMINLPGDYSVNAFDAILQDRKFKLNEGDVVHYHGTDAASAESILKNGIDLTKSAPCQDFSNGCGFYVTTSLRRAVSKARWRAKKCHLPWRQGAIIAITIPTCLQEEQNHLALTLDTEDDRMVWENIITHYRSGELVESVADAMRNMKFIQGPAAKYGIPRKGGNLEACSFTQTCLLDKDYAKRFGRIQNVAYVMFFSDRVQWLQWYQEIHTVRSLNTCTLALCGFIYWVQCLQWRSQDIHKFRNLDTCTLTMSGFIYMYLQYTVSHVNRKDTLHTKH